MRCATVQSRLITWQDDELAPGEAAQVEEHVHQCAACRSLSARLGAVQIDAPLVIPPAALARLHAATEVDLLLAAAADENRTSPFPPEPFWRRWLVDAVEVPGWTVLVAAAAVCLLAVYAVQTQWQLDSTQAELAARTVPITAPVDAAPSSVPADQFRPASYQPGEEHGYR